MPMQETPEVSIIYIQQPTAITTTLLLQQPVLFKAANPSLIAGAELITSVTHNNNSTADVGKTNTKEVHKADAEEAEKADTERALRRLQVAEKPQCQGCMR